MAQTSPSLIAAWSKPLHGLTDPLVVESLALSEAVIFVNLRGYEQVIFETDCLEVINLWKAGSNPCSVIAPILLEIGEIYLLLNNLCFNMY